MHSVLKQYLHFDFEESLKLHIPFDTQRSYDYNVELYRYQIKATDLPIARNVCLVHSKEKISYPFLDLDTITFNSDGIETLGVFNTNGEAHTHPNNSDDYIVKTDDGWWFLLLIN